MADSEGSCSICGQYARISSGSGHCSAANFVVRSSAGTSCATSAMHALLGSNTKMTSGAASPHPSCQSSVAHKRTGWKNETAPRLEYCAWEELCEKSSEMACGSPSKGRSCSCHRPSLLHKGELQEASSGKLAEIDPPLLAPLDTGNVHVVVVTLSTLRSSGGPVTECTPLRTLVRVLHASSAVAVACKA